MKKHLSILLAVIMAGICLFGCGQKNSETSELSTENIVDSLSSSTKETIKDSKKIKVVTTIFPEYDWVKQIVGNQISNMELTMLLDNGVDLHSYQPTAEDILKVSECDLFIYVGGESDAWVEDALKEAVNKDRKVINLLNVLGNSVKAEEVIEGMEAEEEHEGDKVEHAEDEEIEYDEHVWLSLKNAVVLCQSISDSLQEIDPQNKDFYSANTSAYIQQLSDLDAEYQTVTSSASQKTLLFADRFPFRYLVDDYGLSYYAAFVGCSAETEATFETISFLAGKVDELRLKNIMTLEKSDQKIAKTIIENTTTKDQRILTLDSMQSTTSEDIKNQTTYFSIMEKNLDTLKEALQ